LSSVWHPLLPEPGRRERPDPPLPPPTGLMKWRIDPWSPAAEALGTLRFELELRRQRERGQR
jgi:hypothetical protein